MALTDRWRLLLCVFLVAIAGCTGGTTPIDDATSTTAPGPSQQNSTMQPAGSPDSGNVTVHFINVGQSVSTLIESPSGETMLIDTGHFRDDGEHVLAYLQSHDIERIDHLVVSHNDADHIGGNAAVIEYFETQADGIGAVYDPGVAASTQTYAAYLDAVEQHDVTLYEVREGDTIPFEGVAVATLGPPPTRLDNGARNENNIVLRVGFGNTSFLFPGDAEDDQEAYLVENYGDRLQSTVLKAGHHGSSSSSSAAFLDAVQPRAVVISSAYDSQYGHPTPEVLERLAARELTTFWTGTHGDVVLRSTGERVTIATQQSGPTTATRIREGDPADPEAGGGVQPRLVIDGSQQQAVPATDGGTLTTTPDESTPEQPALRVETVNADAAGDDRDNLNDEYVVFRNEGTSTLDLAGWQVQDAADHVYSFPTDTTLAPGETITLHTGAGSDTASDVYWGASSPIWNNGGDTITVLDDEGQTVLETTY